METKTRKGSEPDEQAAAGEDKADDTMDIEPVEFNIGTPGRDSNHDEGEFMEGPNNASERRLRTPIRADAVKRRLDVHDDEPDLKKIIRDDWMSSDYGDMGVDVVSVRARMEDEEILCKAFLGRNLHDVYSGSRIKLAIDRRSVEQLIVDQWQA